MNIIDQTFENAEYTVAKHQWKKKIPVVTASSVHIVVFSEQGIVPGVSNYRMRVETSDKGTWVMSLQENTRVSVTSNNETVLAFSVKNKSIVVE